jgi:protocatechuate 3,4-dioxygenase beta subunit
MAAGKLSHSGASMENDDLPAGYLLTRREALAALGVSGLAFLAGCRSKKADAADSVAYAAARVRQGTCVARPEQTEGPYFVDEKLNRSDIRTDPATGEVKPGARLALTFNVSTLTANSCAPLANAIVDVWHCDAEGIYSDVNDPGFNTRGHRFLRGYQVTDPNGVARFATIYPGWYSGRAVHIHFKIRSAPTASRGSEFTSQIYFDDAMNDLVHSKVPYAPRGQRAMRNAADGIFRRNGSQLILPVSSTTDGYAGTFNIALKSA